MEAFKVRGHMNLSSKGHILTETFKNDLNLRQLGLLNRMKFYYLVE